MALFREEGPTALFAGVLPALVLVINPILQYTIFEQMKNALEKRRKVTPRDAFVLGALGKLLATSITYPYITVKSRMHVASKGDPQIGMGESLRKVIREEGWAGLYKGMLRNLCLNSRMSREVMKLTKCRNWSQGHTERHYSRLPVRFQGRPL